MATITLKKKDGSEVTIEAAGVQAPAALHGDHALTPRQLAVGEAPKVDPLADLANIDFRTGGSFTQPGPRPATQISPAPNRRFDGR